MRLETLKLNFDGDLTYYDLYIHYEIYYHVDNSKGKLSEKMVMRILCNFRTFIGASMNC